MPNTAKFNAAFKPSDIEQLNTYLGDSFCFVHEKEYRLHNFEVMLREYRNQIAKYLKALAKEERDAAQKNFDFVKDL